MSRFVGRVQELAVLHERLAYVTQGQGQVVGIVGEPGLGKSRLLYEFAQSLRGHAVTYREGQCFAYGSATPYLPVRDLLRQSCGIREADSLEALTQKVHEYVQEAGVTSAEEPLLLRQLLDVPIQGEPIAQLSPLARRARTFALLRQMCLYDSARQPLVLAVENAHWIDATSEEWLATLVERLPTAAILLLVTYRPGYRPPWLEQSVVTQVALPRLLPHESLVAVIGQDVPLLLFQAVTGFPEEGLHRRLRHLQNAEFLYEVRAVPALGYTFKHILTQEVAYQSLLASARREVHQRIAQVLEERFPETAQSQPELLAHHYTAAGRHASAVGYWQRAGQRAVGRSAYAEAIPQLTQGLELLTTLPDAFTHLEQAIALYDPQQHVGPRTTGSARNYGVGSRAYAVDVLMWLAQATVLRGWALAMQGQGEEGIAQIRQGLDAWRATGAELGCRLIWRCWPRPTGW